MSGSWAQGATDAVQVPPHSVALSLDAALKITPPTAEETYESDVLTALFDQLVSWTDCRKLPPTQLGLDWGDWLDTGRRLTTELYITGGGKTLVSALVIVDEAHHLRRPGSAPLRGDPPPGTPLLIDAAALRQAITLFESATALEQWLAEHRRHLQGDVDLSGSRREAPPPLAMVCGIRRLTVPVVPRAPGLLAPVCQLTTRDDVEAAALAPAGGDRAA
ncbi:hypothetical protein ACFYWS_20415 [Streptomyces sp. NPDC002795]|uniref:hypothetical protein n=1 Tax=Streptomyces sp. NPDC002795 TaxID=3364665 RepID=UPI00368835F8